MRESHVAEIRKSFKECSAVMVAFRFRQPWPRTLLSTENVDAIRVWPPSQQTLSNLWIPTINLWFRSMFG